MEGGSGVEIFVSCGLLRSFAPVLQGMRGLKGHQTPRPVKCRKRPKQGHSRESH